MEVRLSRFFDERIRAVDPACLVATGAPSAVLFVASQGTVVGKSIADSWAKGTFANAVLSLEHHFEKHGAGRSLKQYTFDALRFFEKHKDKAQWGRWKPDWAEAFRLKIGDQGGYFTPGGRVLSYWDAYEPDKATV
jgi:hypothetical protein